MLSVANMERSIYGHPFFLKECLVCHRQFSGRQSQTVCSRACTYRTPKMLAYHNRSPRSPEERFWRFVKKTETCWIWIGGRRSSWGYGAFSPKRGVQTSAHIFSYQLIYGPILEGMFVCHRCDNPPCVNPEHLFLGTPKDNTQDCISKNRFAIGEADGNSKLFPTDVLEIRRLYNSKLYSQQQLADRFGVSRPHISLLVRDKSWKHL